MHKLRVQTGLRLFVLNMHSLLSIATIGHIPDAVFHGGGGETHRDIHDMIIEWHSDNVIIWCQLYKTCSAVSVLCSVDNTVSHIIYYFVSIMIGIGAFQVGINLSYELIFN